MPTSPQSDHNADALPTSARGWWAVTALALAVFTVTVTEMMPIGLLTQIAPDVAVTEGAAGLSVTMYGLLAGLSAPVITTWTRRFDRRVLVLAVLAAFVVGNLATASVATYPQLLAARLAMGLCHGLMWSIVAAVACRLVAPPSAASATAGAFSGISLALVLGVPAGTYLGSWLGWRAAFMAMAALCAAASLAVFIFVPALPQQDSPRRRQWSLFKGVGNLRTILAVTAFVVIANYAAYTYITPFLIDRLAVPPTSIGAYLLIYGAAGVIGNFGAGVLLSRIQSARAVLFSATATLTAALVVLAWLGHLGIGIAAATITVWAMAYSGMPVILQTMIFNRAPQERESATSLYVMVFNVSIAVGALVGALAIDSVSAVAPILLGALLCAAAVATTFAMRTHRLVPSP
ncbi:MFS transporter [Mycolicibacterium mageritense]|uniref:MFS transporter n=1 Tax=Mycolicibacterium mageritense TaxID=53462 RepID=UPI001E2E7912|nr:MFS transporter [Mycolicibacterium mageritense]GJJ21426.1 MFS transporter [Mycolicibacterium mageritense]